jgi:hypothetical protein
MGLRLVVYDATGHGRAAVQPLLTRSWRVGVELYRRYPPGLRADASFGATSWTDAVAWLASVEPGESIDEIQYWGHGLPGRLFIARDVLTADQLQSSPLADDWRAVAARLSPSSLVWWRTCSAFAGQAGHALASTMAAFFNCRVAGHTYVIGPLQSGLHSVTSSQPPMWSLTEGFGADGSSLTSTPWAPNTITCLHGAVPFAW